MIGTRAGHLVVVGECKVQWGKNWADGYIIVCRYCGCSHAVDKYHIDERLRFDRCVKCRGEDNR